MPSFVSREADVSLLCVCKEDDESNAIHITISSVDCGRLLVYLFLEREGEEENRCVNNVCM